jgi:protein-tyrosine phosphatase
MNILFVCTANIVRSFMAERILKGKLEIIKRRDVEVVSAGLIDMNKMSADPIAVGILEDHGFDGSNHQSRLLSEDMASRADMILVMEDRHRKMIADRFPEVAKKINLLKTFSTDYSEESGDIRDPYRLSVYHYRLCSSEIFFAVEGLVKCI